MVMRREIILGAAIALLVFLYAIGFDPTPVIILGGFFIAMQFIKINKGSKTFQVVGGTAESEPVTTVSFADIGGQEVAKRELLEALDFAKDISKTKKLGIRPLKGILLVGPPGTGKTMLAKASANYTKSAFIATSGSEFVEMYAGVGAQRVRALFDKARQVAEKSGKESAIVFIDEIDVLGGKRGQHSSHLEYDQTLNQLLVEMDGLRPSDKVRVLVLAATNRADLLDPALLRPGRFDRQVQVDLPDKKGRHRILGIHTRNKPLGADVDLTQLAKETYGFSGAHLESLANEAAILAFREGKDSIAMADFKEAVDKVMMGERLDRRPIDSELSRVAMHEVGHALVSELLNPSSVAAVTVTSRGRALGYMRPTPEDDRFLYTAAELRDQIAVTLGGAVAEQIAFGSRSTGSANDFEQATRLARQMVTAGLSQLGIVSKEDLPPDKMHNAISEIIAEEEQRALGLLQDKLDFMSRAQRILIENERLSGEELRTIMVA